MREDWTLHPCYNCKHCLELENSMYPDETEGYDGATHLWCNLHSKEPNNICINMEFEFKD